MNTKDIEEMRKQKFYQYLQVAGFHKEAEEWFTQHHKAEVQNLQAVMDTVVMLHEQEEMNDTAFCKLRDLLHAIVLTPTNPDKQ